MTLSILYPLGPPSEKKGPEFRWNPSRRDRSVLIDHRAPPLSEADAPRHETAAFTILRAS